MFENLDGCCTRVGGCRRTFENSDVCCTRVVCVSSFNALACQLHFRYHIMNFLNIGCYCRAMPTEEVEATGDYEGLQIMVVWDACAEGLCTSVGSVSCCA